MSSDVIRATDQVARLLIMLGTLAFIVIAVWVYVCIQIKKTKRVIKHTHVSEKNVTVTHPASKAEVTDIKDGAGDTVGKIITTAPSPKSGSTMGKRGVQVLPLDEPDGGFENKMLELTTPKDADVTVDIAPERSNDNPPPPTAESEETSSAGDQVVTVIQPQPAAES